MKRLLCAALTVVMLFALCAPAVGAEETEALPQSYHAPTIQRMIDANLQTGNTDEEFFHLLANAFLVDPAMVSELLSRYTQDEITWLTKAIAYDLQRTDRVSLAAIPADADVQTAAMARLVLTQARDAANSSLDAFLSAEELALLSPDASTQDTTGVFINISPPSFDTMDIEDTLQVEFTVGATSLSSSARWFICKVYKKVNGVSAVAASMRVTIPANQLGVNVAIPTNFTQAGEHEVWVELIGGLGSATVRSGSFDMIVRGKWHITVELTANRSQLGTITLFDASGAEVSHAKCLGWSQYGTAMDVTDGNTPIGVYTGSLGGPHSNTTSYGPYKYIQMTGQSGYVVEHCGHRWGIWIHGGQEQYYSGLDEDDPGFALCPTNGCVRVRNEYQLQLQNEITALIANHHETVGIITITQDGQTTL